MIEKLMLIDGRLVGAEKSLASVNPATGAVLGHAPDAGVAETEAADAAATELIYEPDKSTLLEQLVPMYVDISILRALYESQASELGARMTAMDAATKNSKEIINALTLQFNKARQAGITKELMEIVGGSEALKE